MSINILSNTINLFIFMMFLIVIIIYFYIENNWLELEKIDIKINDLPKDLQGLKIAHVSDVHIPNNGSSIDALVKLVKNENPDIIVMTGDLIDRHKKIDEKKLSQFCRGMSSITKTYAVTGNHESRNDTEKWYKILKQNDIIVLDNNFDIYKNKDSDIMFMGIKEGCKYSDKYFTVKTEKSIPKILLAHRPELFLEYCSDLNKVKPDLVLSGHAHGGQVRIPFINRGVYAPEQGLFPKYSSGLYLCSEKAKMFVSRGLGNGTFPLRINDRTHLPIIRLI